MSIQYAGGTIVNNTLTMASGTRAELADWMQSQLVVAGWTLASTSGAPYGYRLNSALTPQNLQTRVRIYDPGAGNCSRIKFSNVAESKIQAGDLFLLPAASKTYRIIANKYQFFIMTPGSSAPREFASGGVMFLPTFLNGVITEQSWGWGNARNDTDVSLEQSPRTRLSYGNNSTLANFFGLINGSIFEFNNTGAAPNVGGPQFAACVSALQAYTPSCYSWHDDSIVVVEPLLGWGLTATTDQAKIRGQLWDSVIIGNSFGADTNISLDSHTYFAITGSNGGAVATDAAGTLFVAVT